MDNESNAETSSLSKRIPDLAASPYGSTGSSYAASSPASLFSYQCRTSQHSDISSTTSLVGDNAQSEDDVVYYSDGDRHGLAASLETLGSSGEEPSHIDDDTYSVVYPDGHDEATISPRTLLQQSQSLSCRARPANLPPSIPVNAPVPLSCRQNPRRTQRPSVSHPQLVRQSERKENFVDGLVETTTQTIETIWPLSAAQGRGHIDKNLYSLRMFVREILRRSKTSYSTLLLTIHYLIVIMSALPPHDFTMEQKVDSEAYRALQCGRRMFLAALILASKYLQDRNYSTRAWSKIAGIEVADINQNEKYFLNAINWNLHLPEPMFNKWENILLTYSPSSCKAGVPRSSPTARRTWRFIVRQLNADMSRFDDRGRLKSDNDSGYSSEASRQSTPLFHQPPSIAAAPTNFSPLDTPMSVIPLPTLEPKPQEKQPDQRMLPPLQPREGPLPTPQITPQIRSFCTPAVSASGLLPRRSSMGIAMTEHFQCMEEKLLDRPNSWGPIADSCLQRHSSRVPSSLCYDWSSPESAMSDLSRFPSRSSSISSAASSICTLPENGLSTPAMRRNADLRTSVLTDKLPVSREESLTPTAQVLRLPSMPDRYSEDFFLKERPKKSEGGAEKATRNTPTVNMAATKPKGVYQTPDSGIADCSSVTDEESTPRPNAAANERADSPKSQTYEAAAALVDLTLDRGISVSNQPSARAGSRKRERPMSINLGLQSHVRDLLEPHALEDTSSGISNNGIVVSDAPTAGTFLSKGNKGSLHLNNAETWAAFDRKQVDSEDKRKNRQAAEQMMREYSRAISQSTNSSSESLPRKKACFPSRAKENNIFLGSADTTPTPGLSVRKGGGNAQSVKVNRKASATKTKSRGSRKPSAEMQQLLRDEYADMHDSASRSSTLLYGEWPGC